MLDFVGKAGKTKLVRRKIKDGVFKLLFEKPENAAELYYALTDIKCDSKEIQIITISTIISGTIKNDLAFIAYGKALIVLEHQSTPNENMPIRILMYLGQLYEKWFKMMGEDKLLYGTKLHKIPKPQFAVFYNGIAKRPEKEILKLSDAFEDIIHDKPDNTHLGFLEMEVPIYNINKGMNTALFSKGEHLRQYSEFSAKLREMQTLYDDFEKAVKETINYCIDNSILSEFLKENGGKLMSIFATEFDINRAERVWREEAREEGREEEKIEIAQKLIRLNRPVGEIIEITGLAYEQVERLQLT